MDDSRAHSLMLSGSLLGCVGAARKSPTAAIAINRIVFQVQMDLIDELPKCGAGIGAIVEIVRRAFNPESFVQYRIDKIVSNWFTAAAVLNSLHRRAVSQESDNFITIVVALIVVLTTGTSSFASTQGLNQIPTPDMPPQGDLSLSFQAQGQKLGNPYQVQAEMGLTEWFE